MKKTISALIILLMFLVPVGGGASYLIRLKNGGQLSTPMYWAEGKWIFFPCVGGTAGMERSEIDRIETYTTEYHPNAVSGLIEQKESPLPPKTEKPQEPAKEVEEKVNIEAYRSKKDEMTVELEKLLEKQREAAGMGDDEAKKKLQEEFIKVSKDIYKLTDEVTEKNKGKLPDGWWEKK